MDSDLFMPSRWIEADGVDGGAQAMSLLGPKLGLAGPHAEVMSRPSPCIPWACHQVRDLDGGQNELQAMAAMAGNLSQTLHVCFLRISLIMSVSQFSI